MLHQEEMAYYARQILIDEIGIEGQKYLKQSKVLVIGAGGLGCPVLQYLSAAGVGHIGIVDHDSVEISNLHRQVLYSMQKIGKNKAIEAVNVLKVLNPFIELTAFPFQLTTENAIAILSQFDIIVDCTDNYETRFIVNDTAVLLSKPIVYGSIYRMEGQVSVFNYKNGPTYRCLYPEMPKSESITNCAKSGVIGVLPGIIGALQANEVIKLITGFGEVLAGKILVYSAKNNTFDTYSLTRNTVIDYKKLLKNDRLDASNYTNGCSLVQNELNINQEILLSRCEHEDFVLLDVRELNEFPLFSTKDVINIPLSILENRINEIPVSKTIVVMCQSGVRSLKAIELLQEKLQCKELRNLESGISEQFIRLWKNKKNQQETVS